VPKITKPLQPGDENRKIITSVAASEERFPLIDYLPFGRAQSELRARLVKENEHLLSRLNEDGEVIVRLDRGLPRDLWLLLLLEAGGLSGGPERMEQVFADEDRVVLRKSRSRNMLSIFAGDSAKRLGLVVPRDEFLDRDTWQALSMCWVMARAGIAPDRAVELLRSKLHLAAQGNLVEGTGTLERADAITLAVWAPLTTHLYTVRKNLLNAWDDVVERTNAKGRPWQGEGPVIRLDRGLPRSLWSVMLCVAVSRNFQDDAAAAAFAEWLGNSRSVRLWQVETRIGLPLTVVLGVDDEPQDPFDWDNSHRGYPPKMFIIENLTEPFEWMAFVLGVGVEFLTEELRSFPEPSAP